MAILAILDHLWLSGHMSKLGIPEKSYQNVAQQCELDHCNTLIADFIAEKLIF